MGRGGAARGRTVDCYRSDKEREAAVPDAMSKSKKTSRFWCRLLFWRRPQAGDTNMWSSGGFSRRRKTKTWNLDKKHGASTLPSEGENRFRGPLSSGRCSSNLSCALPKISFAESEPVTEPATPSDCHPVLGSVELGPRLGASHSNAVYQGILKGQPVAVRMLTLGKNSQRNLESLNGYMHRNVVHPNLVRVIGVRTRCMDGRRYSTQHSSGISFRDSLSSMFRRSTSSDMPSERAWHPQEGRWSLSPEDDVETWIIMEYCDLGSLAKSLSKGLCWTDSGPNVRIVNFRTVLVIALEVARALAHLHLYGVVHGDLKPENILLQSCQHSSRGFICKVGDFGLNSLAGYATNSKFHSKGTVSHQPPEVLETGLLTPEADVFSFGMLLWELVAGEVPFKGKSTEHVRMSIVSGYRPRIPSSWPVWYAQLVRSCWSHDRRNRPEFLAISQRLQWVLIHMRRVQKQSSEIQRRRMSADECCKVNRNPNLGTETVSSQCQEPILEEGEALDKAAGLHSPQELCKQDSFASARAKSRIESSVKGLVAPHVSATIHPSSAAGLRRSFQAGTKANSGGLHRSIPWSQGSGTGHRYSGSELRGVPKGSTLQPCDVWAIHPQRRSQARRRSLSSVSESLDVPNTARSSDSYAHGILAVPIGDKARASASRDSMERESIEYSSRTGILSAEEMYSKAQRNHSLSFETTRSSVSMELERSSADYGGTQPSAPAAAVRIMAYGGSGGSSAKRPRVISHSSALLSAQWKAGYKLKERDGISVYPLLDKKLRPNKANISVQSERQDERSEPKIVQSIGGLDVREVPRSYWRMEGY